jgi:predicted KAP-like P-loop ATPase
LNKDQPKKLKKEDRFQRYEFSKRVAGIINTNELENSLVIGLYGKWGEGKTSVMNFIKAELASDIIVINFNPWLFSDQGHLIQSFFDSIAFALNQTISTGKEKVGKLMSDYGSAIGSVTKLAGFSLDHVSAIGDKLKNVSIEKLKQRVDNIIINSKKKIVVCIDDIDRLDIEEIQYTFKLVKLVGDFPKTAYILAFDDEMVSIALAPKYGNRDKINGYQFLEKIIQVPLKIPKATSKALRQYTIDLISKVFSDYQVKMDEKEQTRFTTGFEDCFVPQIDNPRLGIRYANTLSFAIPLLMGEVYLADLILVEGLKIFFPEAYDFLRANSSAFLANTARGQSLYQDDLTKEGDKKIIDDFLDKYSQKTQKQLLSLFQELFPQVMYVYKNYMVPDSAWREWYQNKKICSGKYFNRYFTYAVQEGEISDISFSQFLTNLECLSFDELNPEVENLFVTAAASDIIFKLRVWEDKLNSIQSKALALQLVKLNKKFPIEKGEFSPYTTYAEAAKTVAKMIVNVNEDEKFDFTKQLLAQCDQMSFALEVVYWLFYKSETEEKTTVTKSVKIAIQKHLIDRFKTELKSKDFFQITNESGLTQILNWWIKYDRPAVSQLTNKLLKGGVNTAINLIKLFTPTITSYGKTVSTYKSSFTEASYNWLSEVINPELIYSKLIDSKFQRSDVSHDKNTDRNPLTDNELATLFIQLYEKNLITAVMPDNAQS